MRCPDPACDGVMRSWAGVGERAGEDSSAPNAATFFQPPWSVERTSSRGHWTGFSNGSAGTKSCVMGQAAWSARSASAPAAMTMTMGAVTGHLVRGG